MNRRADAGPLEIDNFATDSLGRRLFLVGAAASLLAGCVSGARSTALTAPATAKSLARNDEYIYHAVGVGSVGGGKDSDVVAGSQISSANFRKALENSLDLSGLLASGEPKIVVDAAIEQVDQEVFDINLDVATTVFYRARRVSNGAIVYEKRITTNYEARFSESFVRSERFRLANEGSGRANIGAFVEAFVAAYRSNPTRFGSVS